jgi:hypothetical protein
MNYVSWSLKQFYLFAFLPTQFGREAKEREKDQPNLLNKARVNYLIKLFPWILAFNILGTLIAGYICEVLGIEFRWFPALLGIPLGAVGGASFGLPAGTPRAIGGGLAGWAVSVTLGIAGNTATRFIGSVTAGIIVGVGIGVASRWIFNRASGLWRAIAQAIAVAMAFFIGSTIVAAILLNTAGTMAVDAPATSGYAIGTAFSVAGGLGAGIALGISYGVTYGLTFGAMGGIAFGLAFRWALGMNSSAEAGMAAGIAFAVGFPLVFSLTYFRLLTYLFDVALSASSYLMARRWPHYTMKAWRWCPVYWNEVIWLPLPFVDKLLILLVKQDREEGFRQIAFVAAERRLQRRAAFTALVELAITDLRTESIPEMADVTDNLNWITDTSAELPSELAAAWQRFDRTAQHVGQYLSLHSIYRKSEALSHALAEVTSLQRSLIASTGRFSPRMLKVANDWRALLEKERENIQVRVKSSQEIPNPFIFGNPVVETEHNVFTGRGDIVRQIEASLLGSMQTPTLLLYGPRRMGKTSILNQLPRLLGPDFTPAIVDCQNPAVTESRNTLLRYLSRSICDGLQRRHLKGEQLAASTLSDEPFTAFDEWLSDIELKMPARMRILLCLDEYERLQVALDAGWGGAFLDALRHLLQHRARIALMFTGAHTFQELGPAWTDRFISARRVKVSFLKREEVHLLLTKPIPEFNMAYEEGALDAIFTGTNGQPFLTQAVAFELVQLINEQHRKSASIIDIEEATNRALVTGGEYFANLWSDAGEQGQATLIDKAKGEKRYDPHEAQKWLFEHDILNEAGEIVVPMVKQWIIRTKL